MSGLPPDSLPDGAVATRAQTGPMDAGAPLADRVTAAFGVDGALARHARGDLPRGPQMQLAAAVAELPPGAGLRRLVARHRVREVDVPGPLGGDVDTPEAYHLLRESAAGRVAEGDADK